MKKIFLDIINEEDKYSMEKLYRWFSDEEFLATYDYVLPNPMSKKEVDKMIEDYKKSETSVVFFVKTYEGETIGIAGYDDIIKDNQVATLFIGIAEKSFQGKGYGKETLAELLDYGFNILNLYRIQLNVISFNKPAISLYEKAGFRKEGIMKEFVLRNGSRYDLYMYARFKNAENT